MKYRMIEHLRADLRTLGPVRGAFLASLLLSLVAVQGHLINRDGIFYLEAAQRILEDGPATALKTGAWGILPALIAAFSAVTPFAPETAAQIIDALFMAGSCALLVAWVRQRAPEAAWAACLVVLALPAYNQYRHEILREFGFWFFSLLGLWLAMRWQDSGRWREALACQLALAAAALFRLEAVAFYPALMLWQALAAPPGARWRRALALGWLPLAGGLLGGLLVAAGLWEAPARVLYYLDAANPLRTLQSLKEAGAKMSEHVFPYKYSREEAAYVLFFGLLTIIPVKFLAMAGVFVVPLLHALSVQPLPWAFLAYLLVLAAFVTHQFFLAGRYVSFLHLLALPLAAVGLAGLMRRFARWRALMVALALLTMTANVISLTPKKTHIVEAGRWLGAKVSERSDVCLLNSRLAYYAGWETQGLVREASGIEGLAADARCVWLVVEVRKKDDIDAWLRERGLLTVRRFDNVSGDAVIIARRDAGRR